MENQLTQLAKSVGSIIKIHREKNGSRQGDVATKAGISVSMLSQIERGVTSPSIETLSKICAALDLSMSQVFSNIEENNSNVKISIKGKRPTIHKENINYEQLTSYNDPTHSTKMFMISLESGAEISFPADRRLSDGGVIGYVLSGSAILNVDGDEYFIKTGNGISFQGNLEHSIKNRPQTSFSLARKFIAIWIISPFHSEGVGFK